jgi:hypothetical protein
MDGDFGRAKYPHKVRLATKGPDANALVLMAEVSNALKQAQASETEQAAFLREAKASDYENLKQTCERWVQVEWFSPQNH